jgi:hypothetical protein
MEDQKPPNIFCHLGQRHVYVETKTARDGLIAPVHSFH